MFDRSREPMREAPLFAGLALVACGAVMMRLDPPHLDMPERRRSPRSALRRYRRGDPAGAAAQETRERVAEVMPNNLAAGIGRSVMFAGMGLLAMRLLDRLAGDD